MEKYNTNTRICCEPRFNSVILSVVFKVFSVLQLYCRKSAFWFFFCCSTFSWHKDIWAHCHHSSVTTSSSDHTPMRSVEVCKLSCSHSWFSVLKLTNSSDPYKLNPLTFFPFALTHTHTNVPKLEQHGVCVPACISIFFQSFPS